MTWLSSVIQDNIARPVLQGGSWASALREGLQNPTKHFPQLGDHLADLPNTFPGSETIWRICQVLSPARRLFGSSIELSIINCQLFIAYCQWNFYFCCHNQVLLL
jgi:hypothetical protein